MPAFGPCRRACFFCRRTPLSCLSSPHCSLPRLSFRLPFFSCRPASPSARISLCPFLPLPASLSARISPALSGRPPSSVFRLVFLLSFLVFPFIVHRSPLVVRRPLSIPCRPLSIPCRPLSIPCRLLSIARCAVHRSSPVVCCPSPIVYPLLPVARNLPPAVHRPPLVGGCPYPAAPLSAALRSGSRLLYPRNPGLRVCGSCLPCRSAAGSVGRSFRKNASALRTLVAAPFLTK